MTRTTSLALALLCLFGAAAARAQTRSFSAGEQRRLLAGELVRRDASREQGGRRLFGGTSFIRVRAPVETVWRAVRDLSIYPRLIPSLARVDVVRREGDGFLLRMTHRYALSSSAYHVRMRFEDAAHRVSFEVDHSRPSDVRGGRGFLELREHAGGTIVMWGMLADVGDGVVARVFGPFLSDWLLKPPRCLRDELEPGRVNEC